LKARVKTYHAQTKEELQELITRAWDNLDQDLLDKMVSDFGSRVQLLIKARGRSISPYLSPHRSEPTRADAMANADFMPFEEEEDTALNKQAPLLITQLHNSTRCNQLPATGWSGLCDPSSTLLYSPKLSERYCSAIRD
jgi:hypothetical protein